MDANSRPRPVPTVSGGTGNRCVEWTIIRVRSTSAQRSSSRMPPFLKHDEGVLVPHWFLILIFLLPWTVFLAWRWRRMRGRPPR